jgi:hypothetical protein
MLDSVSTQNPPQILLPTGHAQEPPEQKVPPVHSIPQLPQLVELLRTSTHELPHAVSPGPQLV